MASNDSQRFASASRYLTLGASLQEWEKNWKPPSLTRGANIGDDPEPSKLPTGYELLHSFYAPGLQASSENPTNTIQITQVIDPKSDKDTPLTLSSTQDFVVVAPQFSLPDGDIHSVYPPQGSAAAAAILPHVVFNDPHLPWEREVVDPAKEKEPTRNKTPWLALMAFTADEILLDPAELAGPQRIFASDVSQMDTLAITQTVTDLNTIKPENAKNCVPAGTDPSTVANWVFLRPDIFNAYFSLDPVKDDGVPAAQTAPDLSQYRFLAHSRAINTAGMANAGIQDDGLYSVVVSRRCGVWDNKAPVPIYVHLVSLDEAEMLAPWPMAGTKHVALCSLYSWTYRCLPPESVDVRDALVELGSKTAMLGVPETTWKPWTTDPDRVKQHLGQRLQDGFSLCRYHVQTGEETAAFYRGPLAPTEVDCPIVKAVAPAVKRFPPEQSTYSTDLQILDSSLGIMDVTYSAAWQLGRTLGLADQAFCTALGRLRTAIQAVSLDRAKQELLAGAHATAADTASHLTKSFHKLRHITATHEISPHKRWNRAPPGRGRPDLSLWSSKMQTSYRKAVADTAASFASSPDGGLYNEMNRTSSADYAVVLKWVLDRKFLFGIPAYYLITDPSHLPPETLRFFQIDQNWVDALIDGALSLANHLEQGDDPVRAAIWTAVKTFLDTPDPVIGYKPQIPTYGFLLRSDIVTQFPDLHVSVPFTNTSNPQASLLRHENIGAGAMLVLLDRLPGDKELTTLTLTQPPHQQRFAAAATVGIELGADPPVTTPEFELEHRRVFTVADPPADVARAPCGPDVTQTQGVQFPGPPLFDFATRMVYTENFAAHTFKNLHDSMPAGDFTDTVASAAMMAVQLNDPVYSVTVTFPGIPAPSTTAGPHAGTSRANESEISATPTAKQPSKITVQYLEWLQSQKDTGVTSRLELPMPTQGSRIAQAVQRRQRSGRSASSHRPLPPPHTRPIRKTPPLSSPPPDVGADPSDRPQFQYGTWPVTSVSSSVGTTPPPVPTTPTPQDLVMSVQLPPDQRTVGAFFLTRIAVSIPYGHIQNPQNRTNLFCDYGGAGPVMLSNLRFNVQASYSTDNIGPIMVLTILPRVVSGSVGIAVINEMSVLLPEVVVNPYKTPGLFVEIAVEEDYTTPFGPKTYTTSWKAYLDVSGE